MTHDELRRRFRETGDAVDFERLARDSVRLGLVTPVIDGDAEELAAELEFLRGCCLDGDAPDGVDDVFAWVRSDPDEEPGYAVYRRGEKWYALEESQDYTGHG